MELGSNLFRIVLAAQLVVLLIGLQTLSFVHALDHEPVSAGDPPCATCVSMNQLLSVAIDADREHVFVDTRTAVSIDGETVLAPRASAPVRQRGPPLVA